MRMARLGRFRIGTISRRSPSAPPGGGCEKKDPRSRVEQPLRLLHEPSLQHGAHHTCNREAPSGEGAAPATLVGASGAVVQHKGAAGVGRAPAVFSGRRHRVLSLRSLKVYESSAGLAIAGVRG